MDASLPGLVRSLLAKFDFRSGSRPQVTNEAYGNSGPGRKWTVNDSGLWTPLASVTPVVTGQASGFSSYQLESAVCPVVTGPPAGISSWQPGSVACPVVTGPPAGSSSSQPGSLDYPVFTGQGAGSSSDQYWSPDACGATVQVAQSFPAGVTDSPSFPEEYGDLPADDCEENGPLLFTFGPEQWRRCKWICDGDFDNDCDVDDTDVDF